MSFSLVLKLISNEVEFCSSTLSSGFIFSTFESVSFSLWTKLTLVSPILPRLLPVEASSTSDTLSIGLLRFHLLSISLTDYRLRGILRLFPQIALLYEWHFPWGLIVFIFYVTWWFNSLFDFTSWSWSRSNLGSFSCLSSCGWFHWWKRISCIFIIATTVIVLILDWATNNISKTITLLIVLKSISS